MTDRDARERRIFAVALSRPAGAVTLHDGRDIPPERIVELWLRRLRSADTRRVYASALATFAAYARKTPAEAAAALFAEDEPLMAMAVEAWVATIREACAAPATIRVRVAALRSLLAYGRSRGQTRNRLEIDLEPARAYRDTAGPPVAVILRLFEAAAGGETPTRDAALLSALFLMGLRRGSVSAISVGDVRIRTVGAASLMIRGKGRAGQAAPAPLEGRALTAFQALLGKRPADDDAPLFVSLRGRTAGRRLTPHGIRQWLAALCRRAGLPHVNPHALRHAFVTQYLEESKRRTGVADIYGASAAALHSSLDITRRYHDNWARAGAGVSLALSEVLDASAPGGTRSPPRSTGP